MGGNEPGFETVRVVVVARSPALRAGLRALIDGREGIDVVGEAAESDPALASADVAVVDLPAGPGRAGSLEGELPRVWLGEWRDGEQLPPGSAYLRRDAEGLEIAAAVRAVARGLVVFDPGLAAGILAGRRSHERDEAEVALTEREAQVLALMAEGLPNKAIALRLGISEHTAKYHVAAILGKLGAASRTEAVTLAARRGLLLL